MKPKTTKPIKIKIYDIDWDVDVKNDLKKLPKKILRIFDYYSIKENGWLKDGKIVEDLISDYFVDWLSNEFGFCHNGFNWDFVK